MKIWIMVVFMMGLVLATGPCFGQNEEEVIAKDICSEYVDTFVCENLADEVLVDGFVEDGFVSGGVFYSDEELLGLAADGLWYTMICIFGLFGLFLYIIVLLFRKRN